jgi:hypothetical protein
VMKHGVWLRELLLVDVCGCLKHSNLISDFHPGL